MYRDYKARRADTREMKDKISRPERNADPAALKRFRAVPYQLEYQRKYGKDVQAGGGRQKDNASKERS